MTRQEYTSAICGSRQSPRSYEWKILNVFIDRCSGDCFASVIAQLVTPPPWMPLFTSCIFLSSTGRRCSSKAGDSASPIGEKRISARQKILIFLCNFGTREIRKSQFVKSFWNKWSQNMSSVLELRMLPGHLPFILLLVIKHGGNPILVA